MYDPKPIDMTDALMQVYEKAGCGKGYSQGGEKKLDAVGKEDKDIDNDGDHDKSDKYLLNRRKVRGQAIATRKEEVEELMGSLNEEQLDEVIETIKNFVGLAKNKDHKVSDKTPMGAAVTGLQKRRQATNDAMKLLGRSYGGKVKKEEVIHELSQLSEEQLEYVLEVLGGKKGDGYIGHPVLDIKNPLHKGPRKQSETGGKGIANVMGDRSIQLDKARGRSYGGKVKKEEILHDLSQLSEEQLEEIHESLFDAAKEKLSGTKIGGRIGKAYNSTPKKAQSAMTQVGQSMAAGLTGGSSRNQRGGAGGGLGINKIARDNNISGSEMKKAGPSVKAIMTKGVDKGLSSLGFSKGGKVKKEALVFSDAEIDFLVTEAHDIIEELSDEVLISFFEDAIIELAEDQEDLMEMCNELELRGIMLQEASDRYYDDAVQASKDAAKKKKDAEKESMGDRLRRLASKAGENLKKGAKAVVGAGARAAGHAAGEFSAQKERSKKAAEERNAKKDGEKKSEKKGDGDETGGKLDKVLADIRGRKDSDSDSGGGESSSGGGGEGGGKKKPGLLRRIGKALKSGLKKAVGRTARMVSSGSDKLANRLGEDFEQIDSLIESGLFTWTEIEDIVEGVRDEDPEKGTEERKKRLEKKRGMKLDDHPQYKKEAN